ncbi:hypothetical protein YPPY42_1539, partial [Yersinia pestis PY-42]
MGCYWR